MSSAKAFGDMLRRQRERRGIALKTVAEQTKIGPAFLVALERGDCSKWPGGIYSRAWIRAYAVAIGLDPEDVGSEFRRCFARTAFPEGEPVPSPAPPNELPRITPFRLTLEPDPRERVRLISRRALFFGLDLLVSAFIAALASVLTVADFWMVCAGTIVACHAVGLFGGGGSALGWIERWVRRHGRPHDEAAGESAMPEAA